MTSFCIALFESEAIADSRGDECNQMVSVARQEINIIALNCISRAQTTRDFRAGNARAVPIWPDAGVFFGTEPWVADQPARI